MKYASEDLREEHEGILFGLEILEEMVVRLNDASLVETEDLEEMVHFLKLFADKCHHGKEEGIYFPALEKAGIPREGGPIGVMLREHDIGRSHLARMDDALTGQFSPHDLAAGATDYISLLRTHIDKENNALFPMGDERIPLEEQAALLASFERFEIDVMGAGTHEKLHRMLNAMQQKYPT